ncbi:MAG: AAA family ATPase [Candidatus Eisenbacteria bacterium]|nr:AAA family ATPase [Candidatus Eisenbacteria bacterium]
MLANHWLRGEASGLTLMDPTRAAILDALRSADGADLDSGVFSTVERELDRAGKLDQVGGAGEIARLMRNALGESETRDLIRTLSDQREPTRGEKIDLFEVTRVATVTALAVEWLWASRIPLGMLTVLDGDPGLGKSTVTLDLAARLSRGAVMPDGTPGPAAAGVVILSAEDDLARTIRPRLEAVSADLMRIATVAIRGEHGATRDPLVTAADLAGVEHAAREVGAKLIVIDPLMAFLPSGVDAHRDQDVRRALALLRALAERTGAAVLVVRHLNKSGGARAVYRGGGSIGIIGAARAGLLLAVDPENEKERVLAAVKMNLAPMPGALRMRIVLDAGAAMPRVEWLGDSARSASELLADEDAHNARCGISEDRRERTAADLRIEVAAWFADGEPMRAREDAVPFLVDHGLSRDTARLLIAERNGVDWQVSGGGRKGSPRLLLPAGIAGNEQPPSEAHQSRPQGALIPADRAAQAPPESSTTDSAPIAPCDRQDSGGRMNAGLPESSPPRAALDAGEPTGGDSGGSGREVDALTGEQRAALARHGWEPVPVPHVAAGSRRAVREPGRVTTAETEMR